MTFGIVNKMLKYILGLRCAKLLLVKVIMILSIFISSCGLLVDKNEMPYQYTLRNFCEKPEILNNGEINQYYEQGSKIYFPVNGLRDIEKAKQFFLLGAESCDEDSMYMLGLIYFSSDYIEHTNYSTYWFQKAAELGHVDSLYMLCRSGYSGVADISANKSLHYCLEATQNGSEFGYFLLGEIYAEGWGVEKNCTAASEWFSGALKIEPLLLSDKLYAMEFVQKGC